MLFFIAIHGGLLIMMGQHARSESLFYYFRLEDQVPENRLLRLIDRHISFDFVGEKLRDSYSETGWPSMNPKVLRGVVPSNPPPVHRHQHRPAPTAHSCQGTNRVGDGSQLSP